MKGFDDTPRWSAVPQGARRDMKRPEGREEIFSGALLALFERRAQRRVTDEELNNFLTLLGRVKTRHTLVQASQHVEIDLNNNDGDARISFKFDIVNYGFETHHGRTHRFWFDHPQGDIKLAARDGTQKPLLIETPGTTLLYREVHIQFSTPLEPADRQQYELSFEVQKLFRTRFYDLSPRAITNVMSLTILGPADHVFDGARVTHESADGFLRDDPPPIALSREGNRPRLHWKIRFPSPGDLLRTYW